MLAAYPCNEPGGDRLWDVSGRGNHGTFGGGTASPTRKTGSNGRYISFAAASSQKVTLPIILNTRRGWTILALARWTDNANKMTLWAECQPAGNATHNMHIVALNRTSADAFSAGAFSDTVYDNAGGISAIAPASGLNNGKWHLLVSTCRTDGTREGAIDGANAIMDTSTETAPSAMTGAALGVQPFTVPLEFGSFDLAWIVFIDTYMPMSLCTQLWTDPFGWLRAA